MQQYEGILARQGGGSQSVGFQIGELVWRATPANAPGELREQQEMRGGANGSSFYSVWPTRLNQIEQRVSR